MSWYLEALKKYAVFSGRSRRREYWYFVESVSMAGVREKFTPVFKSKAKDAEGKAMSTPAADAPAARPSPKPAH